MLPKKHRISRAEFKRIVWEKEGFSNNENFSLRSTKSKDVKIAVTVSKKVSKSAVSRNRIRRRIHSSLRDIIPTIEKRLYHITTKPNIKGLKGGGLNNEIGKLFNKFKKV